MSDFFLNVRNLTFPMFNTPLINADMSEQNFEVPLTNANQVSRRDYSSTCWIVYKSFIFYVADHHDNIGLFIHSMSLVFQYCIKEIIA